MSYFSRAVLSTLAFLAYIGTADSLKCAQCTSMHSRYCEQGDVQPTDCNGLHQGALFCVTYFGEIRRGRVVFRDCSYVDFPSVCQSQLLENEETSVCYETCETDGCNTHSLSPSVSTKPSVTAYLNLMPFLLFVIGHGV